MTAATMLSRWMSLVLGVGVSLGAQADPTAACRRPGKGELGMHGETSSAGQTPIAQLIRFAAAGDSEAQYQLGLRYRDRPNDIHEAFDWLGRAAQAGHVKASFALGVLHAEWDESEQALCWLKFAAAHGHQRAENVYRYLLGNDFALGC